ncbi:hypothetical protein FLA_0241 [Filimonas lacunae]|nr:hypothetical protein FLA_0241 [Filimonas lacunae]
MFSKWIALVLLVSVTSIAHTQTASDIMLVKQTSFYTPERYYKRAGNNDSILQTQHKNVIAAWNPFALAMKGSMFIYQHVLTQQLSRKCPYEISCSNYSKHAIHEFGLIKGMFVSADRLLRCNRLSASDISPLDIDLRTGAITDDLNKYR